MMMELKPEKFGHTCLVSDYNLILIKQVTVFVTFKTNSYGKFDWDTYKTHGYPKNWLMVELNLVKCRQRFGCLPWNKRSTLA